MNSIMTFENTTVQIIKDENGEPLFELYSTGIALGYVKYAKDRPYPKKDRIDIIVENAEIKPVVQSGQLFLNESQLYDFMLEARTDKCRKFRKWVTNEVLPSIRKTGSYTVPTTPTPQPTYEYIDKTYNHTPVVTIHDISYLFNKSYIDIYLAIKKVLTTNLDYLLLNDISLRLFKNENPKFPKAKKHLIIIFKSGFDKLVNYFGLSVENVPAIMTKTISNQKGFAVGNSVVDVMSYVRRELKGIEALTYLLESNDSSENLENYRRILVNRLSAISWWKLDVQTVKLGIHSIEMNERKAISAGERGLRY